jgi:hypothetical protein
MPHWENWGGNCVRPDSIRCASTKVRHGDFFEAIDTRRVILTRTTAVIQRYKDRPLLFIRDNDPLQQMMQVVRELDISRSDLKPFSRCLACNMDIFRVDREVVVRGGCLIMCGNGTTTFSSVRIPVVEYTGLEVITNGWSTGLKQFSIEGRNKI